MPDEIEKGNKPRDYKDLAAEMKAEGMQVRMWRAKIDRAQRILDIQTRLDAAIDADAFVNGTKDSRGSQKVYCNYLLLHIEELHRQSLPRVPACTVEPRSERAEAWTDKIRELTDQTIASLKPSVKEVINQAQWDDSRFGIGFVEVVWEGEYREADATIPNDSEQQAIEVEHADAENQTIESAKVAESDIDKIHLFVHRAVFETMMPGSPEYDAMHQHIDDHESRLLVVDDEGPGLRRIEVQQFAYDPDVPWRERPWDAYLKSVRVEELIQGGFKNVNKANCPPEQRQDEIELPYEDLTVRLWYIHDRRTNEQFVISADGPTDGYFLRKAPYRYGTVDTIVPLVMRTKGDDRLHGAATIQLALPILERLAEVDFFIDRHVRTHCDYKMATPRGAMDSKAKQQMNDPNVRFVELPPEALAGMKEVKPPPIPQTLLDQRVTLLNELRRVIGMDAQDVGASNPHAITATESSNRAESSIGRKNDRQETIGAFLSECAKVFLELYKRHGTKKIPVKMLLPEGGRFEAIDPADIPDDLDVYFDVQGESDAAQAENRQAAIAVEAYLAKGLYPADQQKFGEWFMRTMGVRRPEQFRLTQIAQPMGQPDATGAMPSMAGVPGAQGPQPGATPQPQMQPQTQPAQPTYPPVTKFQ